WTAFGSVFALLLGYSRVPYAAAKDGYFFKVFARLHPSQGFPSVSLVVLGVLSILAGFVSLGMVIDAFITTRILVQFIGQIGAVTLLRRRAPDLPRPYRMWLYPVPSLVALLGWIFIFATTPPMVIAFGLGALVLGIVCFAAWSWKRRTWPFEAQHVVRLEGGTDEGLCGGHRHSVRRHLRPPHLGSRRPATRVGERLPRPRRECRAQRVGRAPGTQARVFITKGCPMIGGLTTFTLLHVVVSLVGIFAGCVVAGGLVAGRRLDGWTGLFLVTTIATSVTGFGFPFVTFLPSHAVGIISLVVLAAVIVARYVKHLHGAWRNVYVVGTVLALYLNVFVLLV